MPPGFGPRAGCAISSSTEPGCDTTRTTSGASCASWAGPASAPAGGPWSATRRRSGTGRSTAGRGLKKALCERCTIVFIDESGLSERPHRVRTWAPRGQTPVLQYHFNWKVLSAAAGITWWSFYFRLYPTTIRAPQVVDFLGHLLRHLPGKLLVVWDGLPAHRARLVSEFIRAQRGPLAIEWLPGLRPGTQSGGVHLGATGNITSCPTSARAISPSSAIRPAACCAACAGPTPGTIVLAASPTVTMICRTQ